MRVTRSRLKDGAGKDAQKDEAEKEENTFYNENEFKELKF